MLGDFNSQSPMWGSDHLDQRGRLIEQLIDETNLVVLNTGEGHTSTRDHKICHE